MLLSFSIGIFQTNYDITYRKIYYILVHSIVRKQIKWEKSNLIDTNSKIKKDQVSGRAI